MTSPQGPVTGVIEEATGRSGWRAAVVLGSGLGDVAEELLDVAPIPYSDIQGMPASGVTGHRSALYAGEVQGTAVLAFAGRVHLYEGHDPEAITYAVRTAVGAGCSVIVLLNAAGAINPTLTVGAPCLISDHLNLTGRSPLLGPNSDEIGPRFLDLTEVYDSGLRSTAKEVDPDLQEGVYAGVLGPTYETPAEVRMLRTLGADMVGMSTVVEAIAARYLGARVLGISVVSNLAAGLRPEPLSHEEVVRAPDASRPRLIRLLQGVLGKL